MCDRDSTDLAGAEHEARDESGWPSGPSRAELALDAAGPVMPVPVDHQEFWGRVQALLAASREGRDES